MKRIILLFCLGLSTTISHAQNTEKYAEPIRVRTNIERYKLDYELVDGTVIAGDNSILNSLELFRIEYVRQESDDVVFLDKNSGLEILVYSNQKVALRKKSNTATINRLTE